MIDSESKTRSLLKALSWRLIAFLTTWVVAWEITGSNSFALSIGVFDFSIKLILYYLHERGWQRIKFGIRQGFTHGAGI